MFISMRQVANELQKLAASLSDLGENDRQNRLHMAEYIRTELLPDVLETAEAEEATRPEKAQAPAGASK